MALTGLLSLIAAQPRMQRHLRRLEPSGATASAGPAASLVVDPEYHPLYLGALWHARRRPLVVITPRLEDARRLHDQLLTYLGDHPAVLLMPEPETLPFERLAVDSRTGNQRLAALAALAQAQAAARPPTGAPTKTKPDAANADADSDTDADAPPLVVTSLSSALRLTLPPNLAMGRHPDLPDANYLRPGSRIPALDALLNAWVQLGYRREPQVSAPGSFSLRGGILDVFPPGAELPCRIELWGDEVDTIRRFDPETQRSIAPADGVPIIAAHEQLPHFCDPAAFAERRRPLDLSDCRADAVARYQEELAGLLVNPNPETLSFYNGLLNTHTLADYIPPDAIVVLDRPNRLAGEAEEQEAKYEQQRASRQQRGDLPYGFPSPSAGWNALRARLKTAVVELERWGDAETAPLVQPLPDDAAGLPAFTAAASAMIADGGAVVAVSHHAARVQELLEQDGIPAHLVDTLPTRPRARQVYLLNGALRKGWRNDAAGAGGSSGGRGRSGRASAAARASSVALYTDAELFGAVKRRSYRPAKPRRDLGEPVSLDDLAPGSYVVHIDHGVARFAGTTRMPGANQDKEYLVLEYAGDDRLYVPTDQLERLGVYVAATDQPPTLTRLGGGEWQRIKAKAQGAARAIAAELLRLYATREAVSGHRFGPDAAWQRDLEVSFPYQETYDQLRAIHEVKNDMETARPMDRLICGDVGYGKTEVALRAAFKAVNEGMQVAVLVPTTVLAQQHYDTFRERLAPYPVRVEVLSRFRSPREQTAVVAAAKSGAADIVIGTHRILQKDMDFKNLGLVIVDEEHRFGVAHKERLKQMRAEVDVLTLSATPIPRTLHMALAGVRDMSVINTPPEARLPVKTFISEDSSEPVREAILRELERDGQVFFLHNRVRTIHETAADLSRLVPEARFLVGHGQMPENELEDVMIAFANREADVLVCTTIIESGLDMPNVNTIIIDRADRFGLAQLYQLRGRVGRGDHRAYAYLLLPAAREITEAATQRIHAILEANELGAGFRIAMRDLEIRGAGNLLGSDQSGQIHAVGLNLYSDLLSQAVSELDLHSPNGRAAPSEPEPEPPRIDLPIPASIPEDYVAHLPARLAFYQRLSRITDRSEIAGVKSELEDRFGPIPAPVENLLSITDLRCLGTAAGAETIAGDPDGIITVTFRSPVGDARDALQTRMGQGIRVGRRDLEVRTLGDTDYGIARLARALRRVASFIAELQAAAAAGKTPPGKMPPGARPAPPAAPSPPPPSPNGSANGASRYRPRRRGRMQQLLPR